MFKQKIAYIVIGSIILAATGLLFVITRGIPSGFGPGLFDYEYKLGSDCTISRASVYQVSIDCKGIERGIDPEVFEVGWNSQYLVALTHPVNIRKYPNNPDNTYMIPDESTTYGWVVDLGSKETYGPLSGEEFSKREASLGVSDIQLMSVEEAKKKGTWLYGDGRQNN